MLKGRWSIAEAKRHDIVDVQASVSHKRRLEPIFRFNLDLVVPH